MSRDNEKGQVLPIVLGVMVVLLILLPALVRWVQNESRWTVKEQKRVTAFNLAEAGIDRGAWKLKSSTSTWAGVAAGAALAGYNFDATYADIAGGSYRIRLSSGPGSGQATITAEGRDSATQEVRAVQAVYQNTAIPGSLITGGVLTYAGAFEAHWGPALAQNNIVISGNAATEYFPRKFSRQVVSGTVGQPRDTNGLTPPNTDNVEWWSAYDVPELPILDFTTLRSSAVANGTLNYYNVNASSTGHTLTGYPAGPHGTCRQPTGGAWANHRYHFFDSNHHPLSRQNRIWYWDGDLYLTGQTVTECHRQGLWGTLIIRGNLTIATGDCYSVYQATVPSTAYQEYTKLRTSQWDTSTLNEYPADNGYHASRPAFNLGSCSSGCTPVGSWAGETWTGGPSAQNTDVGIRGFLYVGGNLTVMNQALMDLYGAIWVVGNVTNNNVGERSLVFYDSTLDVPVLNVILVRQSWQEVSPSPVSWL